MREPWSCTKDTLLRDLWHPDIRRQIVCQPMMKMPKLWAILSYFMLWCLVDVRATSNFNPEYFKWHLLWQMNLLCSFQMKVRKCGRVLPATLKKSSWTYADSTYPMYSVFLFFFMICTIFAQPNYLFTKWMTVINIHIPYSFHLERAIIFPQIPVIILDQDVGSFSANIVFKEIPHSQIY